MLFSILMIVVTSHAVIGADAEPTIDAGEAGAEEQPWIPGGASWGTAGTHRVVGGHAWPRRGFGLTLGGVGSWAHDVLEPTDRVQAYQGYMNAFWQPIPNLEVAVGGRVDFFADSVFVGSRVLRIGSPTLTLKYALPVTHGIAWALVGHGYFPVVEQKFALAHPAIGLMGAASWRFAQRWQLGLNLGSVYNRTGNALGPGWRNPAQKMADGLVHTHYAHAGASVHAAWPFEAGPLDTLTLIPFAEVTGDFGFGVALQDDPTRLTVGCKALMFDERPVEVMLGVERRITGAPGLDNPFPGELPWSLLLRLALHIDQVPPRVHRPFDNSRMTQGPGGMTLVSKRNGPEYHAVVIRGAVYDAQHQPIPEGVIIIDERKDAPLALDKDGTFSTLPVVVQGNVLRLEARGLGYQSTRQLVILHANQTQVEVSFVLPANENTSIVRGVIFNKRTGKPLPKATVFVSNIAHGPFKVDAHGAFSVPLRDGRYQIIFSAPGFASVHRQLVLDSEVRVILNIGLSHKLPSVLRR